MNHDLLTNQLSFHTIRIHSINDGTENFGTGFLYKFFVKDKDEEIVTLITNKHVVEKSIKIYFTLNKADNKNLPIIKDILTIEFIDIQNKIFYHPKNEIDLAIVNLSPIINELKNSGNNIYTKSINESHIYKNEDLYNISSGEDIIMVGYPAGLYDKVNNQPIFRKGITATNPNLNFDSKEEFLIDTAAFEGSSGSPVFHFMDRIVIGKDNALSIVKDIKLLGVLYQTFNLNRIVEEINVSKRDENTKNTYTQNLYLGKVINAKRILDFKQVLETKYNIKLK